MDDGGSQALKRRFAPRFTAAHRKENGLRHLCCNPLILLAEWTSIELAFQEVPRHPDIACRSLIYIAFLTNLVHSDSRAFR